MDPANRKSTKIIKSPELPADSQALDDRERDARPGHFAVSGAFIKLPDSSGSSSDQPQKD